MRSREFLVLLVAFFVSVAIRWPGLDRPLSAHHEYCTALVMTVLHNWYVDGFAAHQGAPAITFTGTADRYPEGWADGPAVKDGVIYYLSHPPLAYDLPHLLFASMNMEPNVLGLQLLNLLFHFITVLSLYLAIRFALPDSDPDGVPLFASVLYLFMPAPLWFHGNAYMSDMFVQNFWVMHVAIAVRVFTRKETPGHGELGLYTLTLFLTVLTSWLGIFAGVTSFLIGLWKAWRRKWVGADHCMFLTAMAVLVALVFTSWRYTRLVDMASFLEYLDQRLAVRGSTDMANGPGFYLRQLVENYRTGYLPVIALLAIASTHAFFRSAKGGTFPSGAWLFIALTGLPVLMDHVFLLQYSHHDFAALKAGPLLCGVAAFALSGQSSRVAWSAVALTAIAGALYFMRLNPLPGKDDGRYEYERTLGLSIKELASPDKAVLFLGHTPEPQVAWYAKRTIIRIDRPEQGSEFLRDQGTAEGVIFRSEQGVLLHQFIDSSMVLP